MKKTALAILFATTTLSLAACSSISTSKPIHNIEAQEITTSVDSEQVRQAIIEAAASRGWIITDARDNVITATIDVRTHQASVRIPYSSTSYSIMYQDSRNLDQRGNMIHRNYNRWVNNFDQEIRRNLNVARSYN